MPSELEISGYDVEGLEFVKELPIFNLQESPLEFLSYDLKKEYLSLINLLFFLKREFFQFINGLGIKSRKSIIGYRHDTPAIFT